MNINYLVEQSLEPDSLFDNGKPNDSAKYTPKFVKNIKTKISKKIHFPKFSKLELRKLFSVSSKKIPGTIISIDADQDEIDADRYMRKEGYLK